MTEEHLYSCDKCMILGNIQQMVKAGDYLLCQDCFDNLEDNTGYCSYDCMITGHCDQTC